MTFSRSKDHKIFFFCQFAVRNREKLRNSKRSIYSIEVGNDLLFGSGTLSTPPSIQLIFKLKVNFCDGAFVCIWSGRSAQNDTNDVWTHTHHICIFKQTWHAWHIVAEATFCCIYCHYIVAIVVVILLELIPTESISQIICFDVFWMALNSVCLYHICTCRFYHFRLKSVWWWCGFVCLNSHALSLPLPLSPISFLPQQCTTYGTHNLIHNYLLVGRSGKMGGNGSKYVHGINWNVMVIDFGSECSNRSLHVFVWMKTVEKRTMNRKSNLEWWFFAHIHKHTMAVGSSKKKPILCPIRFENRLFFLR